MSSRLFLVSSIISLSYSENIFSTIRDDVFYHYDEDVIPQEVKVGDCNNVNCIFC